MRAAWYSRHRRKHSQTSDYRFPPPHPLVGDDSGGRTSCRSKISCKLFLELESGRKADFNSRHFFPGTNSEPDHLPWTYFRLGVTATASEIKEFFKLLSGEEPACILPQILGKMHSANSLATGLWVCIYPAKTGEDFPLSRGPTPDQRLS